MIKKYFAALFSIYCIFISSTSFSYTQKITPSVSIKETYDSNVGYEDGEDFMHTLIPELSYTLFNERTHFDFSGVMDLSWYSHNSEYDGVDQSYKLDVKHALSERCTFGAKNTFGYEDNSDNSFEDTGENLRIVDRLIYGVAPYLTFDLTENTRTSLNYGRYEKNYQGYKNSNTYSDSTTNSFGLGVEHDLTERTSLGVSASADLRLYDKEDGKNHDDHYKLSLLGKHTLNETTKLRFSVSGDHYYEKEVHDESDTTESISVSAGATYTITERLLLDIYLGTGDQTTFDESGTLGANLEWRGERWKLAGGYKKDITSGSRGYDLQRDRIHAKGEYNISEKATIGLRGVYVYSDETDLDDNDNDDEEKYTYYTVEPYLQYEIVKNSFIKTGYSYGVYIDHDNDDNETRHQVYIMYTMMFPCDE